MTVLILVIFLIFPSSIYGKFDGTYSNLQTTQTYNRIPFIASDRVISDDSVVVHSEDDSTLMVQIGMRLATNEPAANQSQTPLIVETSTLTTTITLTPEITVYSDQTTTTSESTTTLLTFQPGESPPTRSAQLGMGLGITLVGFIIIVEIIYFKRFYRGGLQTDSYLA